MEGRGTAAGEERGGGHGLVPGTHRPVATSLDGGSNPLNIRRKGLSIAFTATLLSSLLATIAAPAVFGAVTVTSAGTVPRGGTSAGTATFQFTENSSACFAVAPLPAGNELTFRSRIPRAAATVHFVGTPTVVRARFAGTCDGDARHDNRSRTTRSTSTGRTRRRRQRRADHGLGAAISADARGRERPDPRDAQPATRRTASSPPTATATGRVGRPRGSLPESTNVPVVLDAGSVPIRRDYGRRLGPLAGTSRSRRIRKPGRSPTQASRLRGIQTVTTRCRGTRFRAHDRRGRDADRPNRRELPSPFLIGSPGTVADAINLTASTRTFVLPGENNQPAGTATWTATGLDHLRHPDTDLHARRACRRAFLDPPDGHCDRRQRRRSRTISCSRSVGTCALSVDRRSCTVTIVAAVRGADERLDHAEQRPARCRRDRAARLAGHRRPDDVRRLGESPAVRPPSPSSAGSSSRWRHSRRSSSASATSRAG